jgi:hypothetical protein
MARWFALLPFASSLLGFGCRTALPSCEAPATLAPSDYALVEYRLREDTAPKVEISDTETYRADRTRYAAAALRLPDACLLSVASPASPDASGSQSLLKAPCDSWLAELERALTDAGLRVLAWDAVSKLEREKGLSTYDAAKELGADVVFVFNELGAADVTAGASNLPTHGYFESDEHGRHGAPLELDERTRSGFLEYTLGAAGKAIQPGSVVALTSSLDVTAIVTLTGESIWFYRRKAALPTSAKQGLKLLFGRAAGGGWTPAAPVTAPSGQAEPAPSAEVEDGGATTPPVDAGSLQEERRKLIRAGAEHFIQAWRSGELEATGQGGDR